MKNIFVIVFMFTAATAVFGQNGNPGESFGIVIHGGAGTILKKNLTPELEKQYREKLTEALMAGYTILSNGGTSLDAVITSINIMEDSPLFNAGNGAVFTHEGTNELDASIMDGKTLSAGAVAAVKQIKNPITLARVVMEKSPHVMMVGEGAEKIARDHGFEMMPAEYFKTERRWKQLQDAIEKEKRDSTNTIQREQNPPDAEDSKRGTVGCVALDKRGNLAAGTSTGGMTNKRFGRVGDAPIIGAGTYANNKTCAVSATGDGEYFIRLSVARDVSSLMEYKGMTIEKAAESVIQKVGILGGTGGVIAIDNKGSIAMPFNTSAMYRAYIDTSGNAVVKIYRE